jgi:hypothetical protein
MAIVLYSFVYLLWGFSSHSHMIIYRLTHLLILFVFITFHSLKTIDVDFIHFQLFYIYFLFFIINPKRDVTLSLKVKQVEIHMS